MSLHPDTVRRIREFFGAHRCCKCDNVAARFCNGRFFCAGHFVPARRHHCDAIDVRAAGLKAHLDAFLIVVAELFGADLADLVAGEEPAQLHVDDGLLRTRIDRDECAAHGGE